MHYKLGAVKAHVEAIAHEVGHSFSVDVIYGFANRDIAGTNTLSDHARGLALDFMTYSNMDKGQAIADYHVANADVLGVKYIIWNRQIWRAERGWYKYGGLSPHTDHVHVSYKADGSATYIPGSSPTTPATSVSGLRLLTDSGTWMRVALFLGGLALIFVALVRSTGGL